MQILPETGAEQKAREQLELLNRNIDLEPIDNINEDHDAYIAIYKQAVDTPAKRKAISNRLSAKEEKEKQQVAMSMTPPMPQGN
jgi:hypothetical protein